MSFDQLKTRKNDTQQVLKNLVEQQNQLLQQQAQVAQQLQGVQNAIIATQASLSTLNIALGEEPLPGTLPEPLMAAPVPKASKVEPFRPSPDDHQ